MTQKNQLRLGAYISPGGHYAGWRHPGAIPNAMMDFPTIAAQVQAAERGCLDAVFFPDTVAMGGSNGLFKGNRERAMHGRCVYLEPQTMLAALATVTRHIGLIATATTSYNHPYHIARRFATIDHISGGRAGWNLVTSQVPDEASNFGLKEHIHHGQRYQRAEEFYDVVVGLWDSWEEDAFILDKTAGRYFDLDKLHFLDHHGEHFEVQGPLNVAKSPQGRPVIAQAGSSEAGKKLAARTADIVFTAQTTLEDARRFYTDIKSRAAHFGRDPDKVVVMPGLLPIVGATLAEAEAKAQALDDLLPDDIALASLKPLAGGIDLSTFPLDGPLPDLPPSNDATSRQTMLVELGRQGLTIRQLARRFAMGNGHLAIVGTPTTIADHIEKWFEEEGADGFNIMAPFIPGPLEDFLSLVVPELQRRGLFRTMYAGGTLKANLGLS